MTRALMTKELREIAPLAALGLLAGLVFTISETDIGHLSNLGIVDEPSALVPFLGTDTGTVFGMIGAGLAVLLGFRQSYWETYSDTFSFLFHRPMPRGNLILTKLATGISTLLVCTALPILLYAIWAATPGTHAGPFEWSMTLFTWQIWISIPLIYLATFASGIRQARWFGSRLFPIATAVLLILPLHFLPHWWMLGFPLTVLLSAIFTGIIIFEASNRDY